MFADDTTVFLKSTDSYNAMTKILETWCKASRAKFNVPKTIVIPIGPRESRNRLRESRTLEGGEERIPPEVKILEEGEGTRILGAWLGPSYDETAPWGQIAQTIERNLSRWMKRRPTLKGKRTVLSIEVGSRTQYLAKVQGMPKQVEDRLEKAMTGFLWGTRMSAVTRDITERRQEEGGLKILNIRARNEAVDLMWLRSYLDLSPSRP
ncbi:hypothetical protein C2E23DRAFT_750105, partial [Lenzites betulinus]